MLEATGYNYSLGLAQINRTHFARFGMTRTTAFDPCVNLRASAVIWGDCLRRAGGSATAFGDALSCYNSGNFTTGYRNGYVTRVMKAGSTASSAMEVVPVASATTGRKSSSKPPGASPEALLTASMTNPSDQPAADKTALLF